MTKITSDNHKKRIFSAEKDLKILGDLLHNKTSMRIIKHLITHEMYPNQIANTLNIQRNLVTYHLKQMKKLNLLDITKKTLKKNGKEHNFYKIKHRVVIVILDWEENGGESIFS